MFKLVIISIVWLYFIFLPITVLSDSPEFQLSADNITITSENILSAKGNVTVKHGQKVIKAQSLVFDRKKNKFFLQKLQICNKFNKMSAKEAEMDADLLAVISASESVG